MQGLESYSTKREFLELKDASSYFKIYFRGSARRPGRGGFRSEGGVWMWGTASSSPSAGSLGSASPPDNLKCLGGLLSRNKNDNSLLFLLLLCSHNRWIFIKHGKVKNGKSTFPGLSQCSIKCSINCTCLCPYFLLYSLDCMRHFSASVNIMKKERINLLFFTELRITGCINTATNHFICFMTRCLNF